ncbi:MAG: DUF697 domain-containing protein [Pseudanabaenaceae cyanobacterium]
MTNWQWLVGAIALGIIVLGHDRWQWLGLVALVWLAYSWWQQGQGNVLLQRDYPELRQQLAEINSMIAEINDPQLVQTLTLQATAISNSLEQPQPRVAIVGRKGVGKTAVVRALTGNTQLMSHGANLTLWATRRQKVTVIDTHTEMGDIDQASALSAEIVILVTDSDLTATEFRFLQSCPRKLLVALNKSDLLLPSDRTLIRQSIAIRCQPLLPPENVVVISAQPRPITVRQFSQETKALVGMWQENLPPDILPLKQRLEAILAQEWDNLWQKKVQTQMDHLKAQAQSALNAQRRKLAESAIVRQQKIVALSLFVSPMPTLDIATSLVLNSQLLIEIAKIYNQPLSLDQAKQIAASMAKQLLQLGGIELITSAISSALKTNLVTYTIGGTLQALTGAYLTYICAQSFMDYLEQKDTLASPLLVLHPVHQWLRDNLTNLRPVLITEK